MNAEGSKADDGDDASQSKKRRLSENDSLDAVSEKDTHDSGGSSYEGGRTPEGSDTLFMEDEDEDISVDDDEPQTSFRSPKTLVGMEDNEDHEKQQQSETAEEQEEKTSVKQEKTEEEKVDDN